LNGTSNVFWDGAFVEFYSIDNLEVAILCTQSLWDSVGPKLINGIRNCPTLRARFRYERGGLVSGLRASYAIALLWLEARW